MNAEADKAKYWQYKLKQKEKAKKTNQTKNPKSKIKTPEKPKKHSSILAQDNFFSSTIQKLKGLLEDAHQQKVKNMSIQSAKHTKEITTSRSQPYEVFKKCRKSQIEKRNQSNSMVHLKKEKKQLQDTLIRNQKKSPNKSRSRSKSRTYKLDKPKSQKIRVKEDKSLELGKVSKKKSSLKTKSTTRKVQTIMLPNLEDESDSWKKKLMETMVIHHDKSEYSPQEELKKVSTFRVWEEYEEKMFNQKKRKVQVLSRYLKGLAVHCNYLKKKENNSLRDSRNSNSKSSQSFLKDIFRSQEEKLLELKQCLFNLKNSNNIHQGLEILISKVNQNISNLKNYDSGEANVNQKSSKKRSKAKTEENQSKLIEKDEKVEAFTERLEEQKVQQRQEIAQKRQITHQNKEVRDIASIHDQTSLNYSNLDRSPVPNGQLSARESQPSFSLKEESSSLLIDSKFVKIQILKTPAQKQNTSLQEKMSCQSQSVQSIDKSNKNNSSEDDMLLSASSSKDKAKQIITDREQQPQLPRISNFTIRKDLPVMKIEESQSQEDNPTFQRSQPLNSQIKDISQLNLQQISIENNQDLINSLNKILQKKNVEGDFSGFIESGIGVQQRNTIFEHIVSELILQTVKLLSVIPGCKFKLIAHYNNEVVEITEHRDQTLDLRENQEAESIIPITTSDQYVMQMAEKVIREAYKHGLPQRVSKALGVPSMVTLRCIRKLNEGDVEEDQTIEFNQQDEDMIQQYSEVIDSELYHGFQENFSPAPDNPYQMIFNRCIYDTLNLLLDEYRPYGSKGMPGICIKTLNYTPPTEQGVITRLKSQLLQLTSIKMGLLQQRQLSRLQVQSMVSKTLRLWKEDVIRYIEKEYNYKQEDDTIQRYELMLEVEEEIFSQEVMQLHLLILNRQLQRLS